MRLLNEQPNSVRRMADKFSDVSPYIGSASKLEKCTILAIIDGRVKFSFIADYICQS